MESPDGPGLLGTELKTFQREHFGSGTAVLLWVSTVSWQADS